MGIWNDESGNALLGLVAEAPNKGDSSGAGPYVEPARGLQLEVRATQHCCFFCSWCAAIISLPHDRLGLMFAGPAIRRVNVRSIATVCGSCSHIASYSLFRGGYGYDTRHKLAAVHPVGTTVLADWLRCEEKSCAYPLPLFVASEGELTGDTVKDLARNWDWEGLTCASGHPILRPAWLYEKGPLQFPAQLK